MVNIKQTSFKEDTEVVSLRGSRVSGDVSLINLLSKIWRAGTWPQVAFGILQEALSCEASQIVQQGVHVLSHGGLHATELM